MCDSPWDPDAYPAAIRGEIPDYDLLQSLVVNVLRELDAREVLELGTGSGETARRLLDALPQTRLYGIDSSREMLRAARSMLRGRTVTLECRRLEDPLPPGPFDAVVSVLTIHHLSGDGKAALFERIADVLPPGGRFVLADVVVPDDPARATIPIEPGFDFPSGVAEQLEWLRAAGFEAQLLWNRDDLALLRADRVEE